MQILLVGNVGNKTGGFMALALVSAQSPSNTVADLYGAISELKRRVWFLSANETSALSMENFGRSVLLSAIKGAGFRDQNSEAVRKLLLKLSWNIK